MYFLLFIGVPFFVVCSFGTYSIIPYDNWPMTILKLNNLWSFFLFSYFFLFFLSHASLEKERKVGDQMRSNGPASPQPLPLNGYWGDCDSWTPEMGRTCAGTFTPLVRIATTTIITFTIITTIIAITIITIITFIIIMIITTIKTITTLNTITITTTNWNLLITIISWTLGDGTYVLRHFYAPC